MLEVNKAYQGDCLELLKQLDNDFVDSIVTDPPYGLEFMGKEWDKFKEGKNIAGGTTGLGTPFGRSKPLNSIYQYDLKQKNEFQKFSYDWAKEALRVLKPGGFLLSFGGTRTYHRMVCAIEDAGFEIRDTIMWLYGCLSEDSEILTDEGWKKHNEINKRDIVFNFNLKTNKIERSKVENVFIYHHIGKMVNLKNDNTDQLLTLNHKVICKEEFREQKNYDRKWYSPESWSWQYVYQIKNYGQYNLPLGAVYDGYLSCGVDFASLLGWILSEGHFQKDTGAINIYQSSVNKDKVDMIRDLLNKLNIKHSEYKRKRKYKDKSYVAHQFYFSGKIVKEIKNWIPNKKPTFELLNLSYEEKISLFNSLMFGDGSKKGKGNYITFYQNDLKFLEWFQVLCHLIGKQARINKTKMSVEVHHNPNTQFQARHLKNRIKNYNGIVWSIQTKNMSYIARRNGKIFITGNSGFPKSLSVGKAIDKLQGNEREIIGLNPNARDGGGNVQIIQKRKDDILTKGNSEWEGWGTAFKPSHEPVILAQKPLNNVTHFYLLCQSKEYVQDVEKSLKLILQGLKEGKTHIVVGSVLIQQKEEKENLMEIGKVESSKEQMDISQFTVEMVNTALNTILLWKNILEEISNEMNKSITLMEREMITDLKILNSLLLQITQEDIIKEKSQVNGLNVNVLLVENLLKSVLIKSRLLNTISAQENVSGIIQDKERYLQEKENLKPNASPIVVARKPLSEKSVALNVLKWGTGGINIDGCRIPHNEPEKLTDRTPRVEDNVFSDDTCGFKKETNHIASASQSGRFPANVILSHHPECEQIGFKKMKCNNSPRNNQNTETLLKKGFEGKSKEIECNFGNEDGTETVESWNCHPDCPIKILDEQSGISRGSSTTKVGKIYGENQGRTYLEQKPHGININDKGGASRFFYCAKSSKSERNIGLGKTFIDIEFSLKGDEKCENSSIQEEKLVLLSVDMETLQIKVIEEYGILNKEDLEWNTTIFGKNIMEKFQKDFQSIIKTETNSITISQILNWLSNLLIQEYIVDVKKLMENGGNLVENVEKFNILITSINEKMASALGVKNAVSEMQLKISIKEKKEICFHPTVKPLKLMKYLVKLITPKKGLVLDPFFGSGTTGIACLKEGLNFIGFEQSEEYCKIAKARLIAHKKFDVEGGNYSDIKKQIQNYKQHTSLYDF